MPRHGKYDHELVIGTTTKKFRLIRDDSNAPMYWVDEEIPRYRNPLRYEQTNWIGGHGQHRNDENKKNDLYFEGQSIDTTQEGRVILGPLINTVGVSGGTLGANPVCFCWFGAISKWMVATATKVFWYDNTNFVEKKEFAGETITHMIEYNGILYVALGSSSLYYTSADGETYTVTDLTDGYAERFEICPNPAGTQDVLRKFKQPNEVSNTTDGTAGGTQWSTPAYIGDESNNITNILIHNDKLLVGREDNLYHYDSDGGIHPLLPCRKVNRSTNNFKYATHWQAGTYFSLANGIGEITGYNNFDVIHPYHQQDIGKVGTCVGLAADDKHLYFGLDEGTNTHIYKVREAPKDGALRWELCPWVFLSTNTCATLAICQHSATDRRLWFGYGNNAGYVILSDNPTADSAARFCASGFVRMSYDYGTEGEWDKLWQSAVLEVKGGDTGETVQVKYRKDADTSATSCIAAAATNGLFETNFASALSCERIQFELHLASNTSTATPEVSYFQAKGVEKPVTVRFHNATYAVGDDPSNSAKTLRNLLRTGRTTTTLIKFADLRFNDSTGGTAGTDYVYCVMEPGYPREETIIHTKGKAPELGITVRLREVSFS